MPWFFRPNDCLCIKLPFLVMASVPGPRYTGLQAKLIASRKSLETNITDPVFHVQYMGWPSNRLSGTGWYQKAQNLNKPWVEDICLSSPTFSRVGEDLFRDVELVFCCSGPVLHSSPALHGEVDVAGNCWHRLSLDGYHWTNKRYQKHLKLGAEKKNTGQRLGEQKTTIL